MKTGARILVIDDNADARMLLKDILEGKGYTVFEAVDGQEALEVLERTLVHLAIVDLDMPRVNGLEFTRRAKAGYPQLPVIMVTAFSQFYSPAEILAAGVDAFLQKPLDLARLMKAIEQL
jgi:two-component system, OmpR family, response regulator